jgi:photosystem II stability/assembly factor-like uncharacterized protein
MFLFSPCQQWRIVYAMNRMVTRTIVSIITILLAVWHGGPHAWSEEAVPDAPILGVLAINPQDSKLIYALATYGNGLFKSTDGGESWSQTNQGIRSYSLYALKIHPKNSKILYLGAGGAGLYKSTDGGATWVGMSDGLQNTDIATLVLHPNDPEIIYVATSTGVFKSPDGGTNWVSLSKEGEEPFKIADFHQSLLVLPTSPPTLFLGVLKGLYTRQEGDGGWVSVGEPFTGKRITALAHDPRSGKLYAAVYRRGETVQTLREGGLFVSDDAGKSWARLGVGLEQDWIHEILIDPVDPQLLYLGTESRGVLKSTDGGQSWKESNAGLTDSPSRALHALVMDPHDRRVLYAASYVRWVFRSRDAGATWQPLRLGPHQTEQQILANLNREDELAQKNSPVVLPAKFIERCNDCHGWTDPRLNRLRGNWRVTPNRRNWALTVKRMSKGGAKLTPAEEVQIAEFLNNYTRQKPATPKD